MRCLSQILLGVVLFAVVGPVIAEEPPPATSKPKSDKSTKANAAVVKTLIQQLKSGKYKERNEATKTLKSSGKADPKDLRKIADEIKAAKQELDRATKILQP